MRKKTVKRLMWAAFIVLNIVVLYFTARADFSKDAPELEFTIPWWARLLYGFGAAACIVLVIGAETAKYLIMMKRTGERVSFAVALETAVLGKYFDCITPSGAGGQPFQIWNLHTRGYSHAAASSMPLASFVALQYSFILVAVTALVAAGGRVGLPGITEVAWLGVCFYAAVPTLVIISAISQETTMRIANAFIRLGARLHLVKNAEAARERVAGYIGQFANGLRYIARDKMCLVELFACSLVYHAALYSVPFFVVRLLGGTVGFWTSMAACIIVYAAVTVVPTPGNSGAAEGSFYLLFSHLDSASLFWAMLIWRFLTYYLFVVIGLICYGVGRYRMRKRNQEEANVPRYVP